MVIVATTRVLRGALYVAVLPSTGCRDILSAGSQRALRLQRLEKRAQSGVHGARRGDAAELLRRSGREVVDAKRAERRIARVEEIVDAAEHF